VQHIIGDTTQQLRQMATSMDLWVEKSQSSKYAPMFQFLMAMSINKKPALEDHWSQDPLFCTCWICDKMPRDMWLAIHKVLHFDIHHQDRDGCTQSIKGALVPIT